MIDESDVQHVLRRYPPTCQARRIESLGGAGGFSGARFWRVATARGTLCLRRWPPEHPDPARLHWIHNVLRTVHAEGFHEIPLPLATNDVPAATHVHYGNHLWELAPWMPGAADYGASPSRPKLAAALSALAAFHQAACRAGGGPAQPQVSPGMVSRLQSLRAWQQGDLQRLRRLLGSREIAWPELAIVGQRIVDLFEQRADSVRVELESACRVQVPLQPCIRDIWDQHVLFEADRVTGLIDFGAMAIDNVATDVARLLGSMAGDNREERQTGLSAYAVRRPISEEEYLLLHTFDRSMVLLAGMNWLRWIYLEGRHFSEKAAVLQRLHVILRRLSHVV